MDEIDKVQDDFIFDRNSPLIELGTLEKYLHNPAFTDRFIDAAANGETHLTRTEYYPKEKKISPAEFQAGSFSFFTDRQHEYADEFESRLSEEIDQDKVQLFLGAFGKLWIDGSRLRHSSQEMMQIKASIRDHDRCYFPRQNIFVNRENCISDSVPALFTPEEMHLVLEITSELADLCLEDYFEYRFAQDRHSLSLNRLYLHRGIFPAKRIEDLIWVEENYLSSYSLAVTVPEVFAQTWTQDTRETGEPAMLGAPYPLFNKRIVMFAPLIRGMSLGQLEVCVAPPIEPFILNYLGYFPSGQDGLYFHEYQFDSPPPNARWAGPLPERIIRQA